VQKNRMIHSFRKTVVLWWKHFFTSAQPMFSSYRCSRNIMNCRINDDENKSNFQNVVFIKILDNGQSPKTQLSWVFCTIIRTLYKWHITKFTYWQKTWFFSQPWRFVLCSFGLWHQPTKRPQYEFFWICPKSHYSAGDILFYCQSFYFGSHSMRSGFALKTLMF
jgi:hypothetical protein